MSNNTVPAANAGLPEIPGLSPEIHEDRPGAACVDSMSSSLKGRKNMGLREVFPETKPTPLASNQVSIEGLLTEVDEVVSLGAKLDKSSKREDDIFYKKCAAFHSKKHTAEIYYEEAHLNSTDETEILRDAISMTQAKTLSGAAIQIADIWIRFSHIIDLCGARKKTYEMNREIRAVQRLLFSALGVVDGLADQKLEVAVPHLANTHLNPWTPVEKRIDKIEQESKSDSTAPPDSI